MGGHHLLAVDFQGLIYNNPQYTRVGKNGDDKYN